MNNKIFDLYAPIIPGKSAAGLWIGKTHVNELINFVSHSKIQLEFSTSNLGMSAFVLFDGVEIIILQFNNNGVLYFICLDEGYKGRIFDKIGIGNDISELYPNFSIIFDSGEDLYYPIQCNTTDSLLEADDIAKLNEKWEGVGFSVLKDDSNDDEDEIDYDSWWMDDPPAKTPKPVQGIISSITVYDWSLHTLSL